MDSESAANPSQKSVDGSHQGQDGEDVCPRSHRCRKKAWCDQADRLSSQDVACNDQAKYGSLAESLQHIGWCIFLISTINDDLPTRHRILGLG